MAILSHDRRRTKALSQAEAVLPIAISPPVSIDYRNLDILSDREDSSNWPAAEHSLREPSQAARKQAGSQPASAQAVQHSVSRHAKPEWSYR